MGMVLVAIRSAKVDVAVTPIKTSHFKSTSCFANKSTFSKFSIEKPVLKNDAALDVTDIFEAISQRRIVGVLRGTFPVPEHANPRYLLRLLCSRHQRPSCRATDKTNELTPLHVRHLDHNVTV
jgi:hypothetical protein